MSAAEALVPTPSQTAGPYVSIGLCREPQNLLVPEATPGALWIRGTLLDGAGDPIPDGLIEIWQADPSGTYRPNFGFGRFGTHETEGRFAFFTVKPGRVPAPDGRLQAPHLTVFVYARGILKPLHTRMYFPDEEEANASDPVLGGVDPSYRDAMTAEPGPHGLHWDIHVQGERQPAFFALQAAP
jgi:protocatechuate 3,4-dioxygenase alpha subunit